MQFRNIFLVLSCVLLFGATVHGQDQLISYQGRLLNSLGSPVPDGTYNITFRIYDAATKGSVLWESNGAQSVTVQDGLFVHYLGSSQPLPDDLAHETSLYLGITVGHDTEMTPRTPLVSNMYSHHAVIADTAMYVAGGGLGNAINFIEDAATVTIVPTSTVQTVKSITLPGGSYGGMLRYWAIVSVAGDGQNLYITVKINGNVAENRIMNSVPSEPIIFNGLLFKGDGNNYYQQRIQTFTDISSMVHTIDPSAPLVIEIVTTDAATPDGYEVSVHEFLVEYTTP